MLTQQRRSTRFPYSAASRHRSKAALHRSQLTYVVVVFQPRRAASDMLHATPQDIAEYRKRRGR